MQENRCVGFKNALTLQTKSKTGSVIANYHNLSVSRRSIFFFSLATLHWKIPIFCSPSSNNNSKVTSLITYSQETFCENCLLHLLLVINQALQTLFHDSLFSPPPEGSGHSRDPWNAIDLLTFSLNQLTMVCLFVCLFRRVAQLARVLSLVLSLVHFSL